MPYESKRRNNRTNSSDNLNRQSENNDLFPQRRSSSSTSPYLSSKNNLSGKGNSSNSDSATSMPDDKKQQEKEATKNATKTAAKGVATYVAGGAGGKAVDVLADTKQGQKMLNKGSELLNRIPGVGKAAKKLDDSGSLKKADKALDIAGGSNGGQAMSFGNSGGVSSMPFGKDKGVAGSGMEEGGESSSGLDSLFGRRKKGNLEGGQAESDFNGIGIASVPVVIKLAITVIISMGGMLFLLVILISNLTTNVRDFDDALGASTAAGDETGNIDYEATSDEARDFYDRINDVKLRFQATGKTVDVLKVVAVYHILNTNDSKISYDDMTDSAITEIANAMFVDNSYDESAFKENLIDDIFPQYLSGMSISEYEKLADDVFDYIDRYHDFIGDEKSSTTCASLGSCVYEIKGFSFDGRNVAKAMSIKDLKVRLMQCGGQYGPGNPLSPIEGEDLVNFEDYVAGVAYGEIGPSAPLEALKAQMIAARSYALARPTAMGNALGKKLEEENGQWVLQIASCVTDQVFCNIDKGCSLSGGGEQGGYLLSGVNFPGLRVYKPPLPEGHNIRIAAAETQGEVLVNNQGYVIQTGFKSTESNLFKALANQGMDYKQILMQVYGSAYGADSMYEASCNDGSGSGCSSSDSSGGTGNAVKSNASYANWKQFGAPWSNVMVGASGQNIGSIGCLVTSVAILIAKSRENTVIKDFNPGTFVQYLNSHGGFVGGGLFVWSSATLVVPTFHYQGQINVSGLSQAEKLSKIKSLLDQGYYVTAEVKGSTGQHWVAIDSVSGNNITMMDPGSNATNMWSQYNWQNTSTLGYYKVSK